MAAPAKSHDRNSSGLKHMSGKGRIATTLPTSLASVVVQQPPSSEATRAHCARWRKPAGTAPLSAHRLSNRCCEKMRGHVAGDTMKVFLLTGIAALFLATGTAYAQNMQTFRDSSGRTIGTATKSGNTTIFRDARGRTTRTATTDNGGTTIFRDSSGRTTGTKSK